MEQNPFYGTFRNFVKSIDLIKKDQDKEIKAIQLVNTIRENSLNSINSQ